ncbi:hypothetical protein HMPREF9598_00107 [Cutibacterium acnes HL050PA1]|nr:hypothetical protein HMPREF9598_00107 [Cutibacterium acnes HL050PA1]EFT07747.1 hypothetical protein HMPREF9618_01171 [Cutibacterium acnes HL082PA1]EGE90826.1 hypothetical protein HMPREF9571_02303 [Cutibacterium acnes HL043PA2]
MLDLVGWHEVNTAPAPWSCGIVRASFRFLERRWCDEPLYTVAVHTRVPFVR